MAVNSILKDRRPDLILSGINRGQNVAEDVTYSGTIAAAMEGTLLGVPSIALSQAYGAGDGPQEPALGLRRAPCAPMIVGASSKPGSRAAPWSTSISPIARPTRSRASKSRRRARATRR